MLCTPGILNPKASLCWSRRSMLQVWGLVISAGGCIHVPWKQWWKIPVLEWGNPGHKELRLCVSGKPGLIVHLQGGDVNPSIDVDWYGWASDRFCDLGSDLVSCSCQYPKMIGGLLLFPLWTEYSCGIHGGGSEIVSFSRLWGQITKVSSTYWNQHTCSCVTCSSTSPS